MTEAQKNYIAIQKKQPTLRGEFNQLRAVETRSAEQDASVDTQNRPLMDS